MGKVPALGDGDATLAEAAAICAYVAERYPEAKLAPPLGDPSRAKYLYWLFFSPGCIEPAIVQLATKIEMNPVAAGWGEAQRVFDVLDAAVEQGPVDSRRHLLGRGYRDRLGAELRGADVQDGADAAVLRRLSRSLRRAPGIPARGETGGGVESGSLHRTHNCHRPA